MSNVRNWRPKEKLDCQISMDSVGHCSFVVICGGGGVLFCLYSRKEGTKCFWVEE